MIRTSSNTRASRITGIHIMLNVRSVIASPGLTTSFTWRHWTKISVSFSRTSISRSTSHCLPTHTSRREVTPQILLTSFFQQYPLVTSHSWLTNINWTFNFSDMIQGYDQSSPEFLLYSFVLNKLEFFLEIVAITVH